MLRISKKTLIFALLLITFISCAKPDYFEDKKIVIRRIHPVPLMLEVKANFNLDKHKLLNKDIPNLDEFVKTIKPLKGKLIIEGHTDTSNTAKYNIDLSMRRALEVKKYMEKTLDLENYEVEINAHGETKPIHKVDNTLAKRAENRRVEVFFEEAFREENR